jgi:hypothetical protein
LTFATQGHEARMKSNDKQECYRETIIFLLHLLPITFKKLILIEIFLIKQYEKWIFWTFIFVILLILIYDFKISNFKQVVTK